MFSSIAARGYQGPDEEYFENTGIWLRGEFLSFYNNAPAPDRMFGSPISDPIPDPVRPGIQVQYFERVRMDYDATLPAGQRITLASLGQSLRDDTNPGEPLNFSTNTNMCRAFANGRLVCYAFLQFYDRYQGAQYFGQPISDTENLDGRLVQYFEHARMEWRLDRPVGERVVLTELGRIDYDMRIGRGANITSERLLLNVHAFLARSVLAAGQEQTVYVVIHDQRQQAVRDLSVVVTVTYPDGHQENMRPEKLTDENGITSVDFLVQDVLPNQLVTVTVKADQTNSSGDSPNLTANTWFRIWW
jgi:hypothetical protein